MSMQMGISGFNQRITIQESAIQVPTQQQSNLVSPNILEVLTHNAEIVNKDNPVVSEWLEIKDATQLKVMMKSDGEVNVEVQFSLDGENVFAVCECPDKYGVVQCYGKYVRVIVKSDEDQVVSVNMQLQKVGV